MSVELNLPVLFQQLPQLEHLSNVEMARAEASQVLSQELAHEERLREREQVQKAEPKDGTHGVGQELPEHGGGGGERRREHPPEEEQSPEAASDNPWSGNILNMKI